MPFCIQCGNENPEAIKFCTKCGKQTTAASTASTAPAAPSLWSYFIKCVTNASFSGRARRREYWGFYLFYAISSIVTLFIDEIVLNVMNEVVIFNDICLMALFYPLLAASVRRLHDIGKDGAWQAGIFAVTGAAAFVFYGGEFPTWAIGLSLASIWPIIQLCFDSNAGENKYGPNPKEINVGGSNAFL